VKVELSTIQTLVDAGIDEDTMVDGWTLVADEIVGMADWGTIWQAVVKHPDHGLYALEYEASGELGNHWDGLKFAPEPYMVELKPVKPAVVAAVKYITTNPEDTNATT
jgi:hypothetical protein